MISTVNSNNFYQNMTAYLSNGTEVCLYRDIGNGEFVGARYLEFCDEYGEVELRESESVEVFEKPVYLKAPIWKIEEGFKAKHQEAQEKLNAIKEELGETKKQLNATTQASKNAERQMQQQQADLEELTSKTALAKYFLRFITGDYKWLLKFYFSSQDGYDCKFQLVDVAGSEKAVFDLDQWQFNNGLLVIRERYSSMALRVPLVGIHELEEAVSAIFDHITSLAPSRDVYFCTKALVLLCQDRNVNIPAELKNRVFETLLKGEHLQIKQQGIMEEHCKEKISKLDDELGEIAVRRQQTQERIQLLKQGKCPYTKLENKV